MHSVVHLLLYLSVQQHPLLLHSPGQRFEHAVENPLPTMS